MTVRENMLPSAMVPGLVTIRGKVGEHKGKTQNVYPVDAKELINSGDYELVENGAVEAARLAATPLRSGMASGIPDELIVAEVTGIEGRVVVADTEEVRDKIREKADNADAVRAEPGTAAKPAGEADRAKAAESAKAPGAGNQGAADKK